ncbi:helix-turn-helix domain-containing protein [Ectobacillus funiculus]
MNLDERSSLLLREIIYNPQLKNKDLEEKYGLSRMQISYSFSKINDWLLLNDLPAIKRSKAGFLIVNPEVFSFLKDENQKEKALPNYILTEKERAQLINLFILGKEEILSLIHFSSALKVSKNTALNDLKIAQELIKPYGLKIVYSRQNGYEINGIEFHKRRLLLDTIQTILGMYNGETLIYELISITKEEIQYLHGQLEK